jgi:hypothetical protein
MKGKYEWSAGAGPKPGVEGPGAAEPVTFETTSGSKIACGTGRGVGAITGPKTETMKFIWSGCKSLALNKPCQSPNPEEKEKPQEGLIYSQPLTGELGFIEGGAHPKVGWDFKPTSGSVYSLFECGTTPLTGTKVIFEGSVIGGVKLINRMTEENVLRFKGSKGVQSPEKFEGGAKDTLKASFIIGLEKSEEAIAETAAEGFSFEEAMEFKGI